MTKTYRSGAVGALLDEYERAILELHQVVAAIPDQALPIVIDPHTANEDCRSVQTVLTHVVSAGFGYATSIRQLQQPDVSRPAKRLRHTTAEYLTDLNSVLAFTENVLQKIGDAGLDQLDASRKIQTGWGQVYDVEQLVEHAIVHILRHRRQLEKFSLLLNPAI